MKSRMRGSFVRLLGAIGAIGFVACASFGGEEGSSSSSGNPPGPNDQDGGPVITPTPGSLKVTFASSPRLVQGGSVKVHVKLERGSIPDTVTITGNNLPEGVGIVPLELKEGVSEGDLELNASATAKQGDAKAATVVARSERGTTADSAISLFVRGAPGALDSTYAKEGTLELGTLESSYDLVLVGSSTKYHYVSFGTSLRRLLPDGHVDSTFSATLPYLAYSVSVATDDSPHVLTTARTIIKLLPTGARDPSYGVNGETEPLISLPLSGLSAILTAKNEVLFASNPKQTFNGTARQVALGRLTLNGTVDPTFNYSVYRHADDVTASAGSLLPRADGSTIVLINSADNTIVLQQVSPQGAVTTTKEFPTSFSFYDSLPTASGFFTYVNLSADRGIAHFGYDMTWDKAFGNNGVATLPAAPTGVGDGGIGSAIDAKGRAITACFARIAGVDQLVLFRFTASGSPDSSFAPSGFQTSPSAPAQSLYVRVVDAERVLVIGARGTQAFAARFWM